MTANVSSESSMTRRWNELSVMSERAMSSMRWRMVVSLVVRMLRRQVPCHPHLAAFRRRAAADNASEGRSVLRRFNTPGCSRATRPWTHLATSVWMALLLACCAGIARAQVSAAGAIEAYNRVDAWVRAWAIPQGPQVVDPEGTAGACVTLRLSGRVLGRSEVVSDKGDALWSAARRAWIEANESFPVEHDALRARRVEELSPRVTIDVQFAGSLTPVLIEDEDSIAYHVSPGLEGIAVRSGERTIAVFPGTMMSTNTQATEALRSALAGLGLPSRPLREQIRAADLKIYRFGVRHLAQPASGAPPQFLYRGSRIIGPAEVTGPALREAARKIAAHLISHDWPGEEPHGMTGDYLPISDGYEPIVAPPIDQSACVLALVAYATTPGLLPRDGARAERFAIEILEKLTKVAPDEQDPLADPLSAAMFIAARRAVIANEPERLPVLPPEFVQRAREVILATFDASADPPAWIDTAPSSGRGLLAFALAMIALEDAALTPIAESSVRQVFSETAPARLIAEMPWLYWAETALHAKGTSLPSGVALAELRATAIEHVLHESALDSMGADLVGGVVFARSRQPLPTWNTLRPLATLASMLRDERLTPREEAAAQFAAIRPMLRFTMQLMIDEPLTHMFRDPQRSVGGVRPALWRQRAELQASALALLAICEALRSTEAIAAERAAP